MSRRSIARAGFVVMVMAASVPLAPTVQADSADGFRDAVAAVRGTAACRPLNYHPDAERAAEIFNEWTADWITHTATSMPNTDPLPALQDLGYSGTKAVLLAGAAHNVADAIKGALLQGYAAIPDCSYTDFGVSVRRNDATGYELTAAVLAGP